MSPLRKLAGQTAIYGISSIIGRLMNFLLTPIYTRIFLEGQYGVITEVYAYITFLLVLLTFGMETTYFRFVSKAKSPLEKEEVFGTSFFFVLGLSAVFMLLMSYFSQPIAEILKYAANPEYVLWFGIIVGLDAIIAIPMAHLRHLSKARTFMSVSLLTIGVNIGLNLFFLVYCRGIYENDPNSTNWLVNTFYNPEIGLGYVFISNLISSVLRLLLLTPLILSIRLRFSPVFLKKAMRYAFPLMILGLAGIANETFDRAFMTHLLPLPEAEARAQLGIYGACYKVALLLSLGIQAFRFAAEPFIFAQEQHLGSKKIYADIMKYYFIVALLISLTLICLPDIALLLIGEEFRAGKGIIPILLAAYVCFGAVFNLSFWYKLNDKTMYGALIAVTGAIITVFLNILLVPKIGFYGAAWATLASYFTMMIFSYFLGQKHYPIPYNVKRICFYILFAFALSMLKLNFSIDNIVASYSISLVLILAFIAAVLLSEKQLYKLLKIR